ncbi:hypothetical protein GCM10025771_10890 [Niveibacterium umoris]|uniref:Protein-tyrosine-phosphatase n=1 Tax=Niveibacterium umoris TaxID=1193620 RepID=A0A840BK70_9RHOO|nr:hypothetical protein [Niveibacterium umoris]MBB4013360.1 hypothetical protein [Niveibacterium umoris]
MSASEHRFIVLLRCDRPPDELVPEWPGHPAIALWDVPHPEVGDGSPAAIAHGFNHLFMELHHRIDLFVQLPLAALDRLAGTRHLKDIEAAGTLKTV